MSKKRKKPTGPKLRSETAIAMHNRGGKGIHGGDDKAGKRTKNKRERSSLRKQLKGGSWE